MGSPLSSAVTSRQRRVVAKHRNPEQALELSDCVGLNGCTSISELEAAFSDAEFARWKPDPPDRHAVFCQRSGLVGEDYCRCTKRLNCRQAFDQGILARHSPHAARQGERCNDRQTFGDSRDGERNSGFDHQEGVLALQQPNAADERGQGEREPDKLPRQQRKLLLKRARLPSLLPRPALRYGPVRCPSRLR